MTLRFRLLVVFGFLFILTIGLSGIGLFGISKSNDGLKTVYEDRTVALEQVSRIDRLLVADRLAMTNALLMPASAKEEIAQVEKNKSEIDHVWQQYMATYLTPEESVLAEKFQSDHSAWTQNFLQPEINALSAGDQERARSLHENGSAFIEQVYTDIRKLRQLQVDVAKSEYELATARYNTLQFVMILTIVIGAALATLSVVILIRGVYRDLGGEPDYAASVVHQIAAHDLTQTIDIDPDDKHSLLFAMKHMQSNLIHSLRSIAQSSDAIATATREIATGNLDLSGRTEEQASALEETSSSTESMATTINHNAKMAKDATAQAEAASVIAQHGGQLVSQVVTTMNSIHVSAQKIADINGVIDGIAFQTNILALNAAVEAARAGEQGRGFAVVATEVRNLAQRSASAAKEIKNLIDHSVSQVESGARLVDQTGATMQEIVESIQRVAHMQAQINHASSEQSAEIEQINAAISQVDSITQQNAALVEEAAAASASLEDQAQNLLATVNSFALPACEVEEESPRLAVLSRHLTESQAMPVELNTQLALSAPRRVA